MWFRWQCGEQMRLGIFAAVKIKKGEEITYDYAFQYDYAEYVGGGPLPCLGPFVSDQPFVPPSSP